MCWRFTQRYTWSEVGSPILAFAGLWDRWTAPASGDEVLSATIIVSGASE